MSENHLHKIDVFRKRLLKIGIEIEMWSNYPWIYMSRVNGNLVTEKFRAEHGFTIAFHPIRPGQELEFTDIDMIFKILRKYGRTNL